MTARELIQLIGQGIIKQTTVTQWLRQRAEREATKTPPPKNVENYAFNIRAFNQKKNTWIKNEVVARSSPGGEQHLKGMTRYPTGSVSLGPLYTPN